MSAELFKAARGLVNRLDKVHKNEHYKSVWFSYANHGGDYSNGPTYTKELAALRIALTNFAGNGANPNKTSEADSFR